MITQEDLIKWLLSGLGDRYITWKWYSYGHLNKYHIKSREHPDFDIYLTMGEHVQVVCDLPNSHVPMKISPLLNLSDPDCNPHYIAAFVNESIKGNKNEFCTV